MLSGIPAFPQTSIDRGCGLETADSYGLGGMDLRDYFAAHVSVSDDYAQSIKEALVGRACPSWASQKLEYLAFEAEFEARLRGLKADAMLKERQRDR